VRRHQEQRLFTEHGPRVYSSAFVTFDALLSDMGLSMDALFVPYNFSITSTGQRSLTSFGPGEVLAMAGAFARLCVDPRFGSDTSVAQFMRDNAFSSASRDYVDRLCLLTDGAGSERYSLNEFLQIANHQALHKLLQPREPNDVGLMRKWQRALEQTGRVRIIRGVQIDRLAPPRREREAGETEWVHRVMMPGNECLRARNVVLAMPPMHIERLLGASATSMRNAFGSTFGAFAINTAYETYIPITFHWRTKQTLPSVWGFPLSEWGVLFIALSEYMEPCTLAPNSVTLLSCAISRTSVASSVTGRSANQTPSRAELIAEAFRQIRTVLPGLEAPSFAVVSDEMTYDATSSQWRSRDTAFIKVPGDLVPPPQFASATVPHLFNCGPHNQHSAYAATSIETAVCNAIALAHELCPNVQAPADNMSATSATSVVHTGVVIAGAATVGVLAYNALKK